MVEELKQYPDEKCLELAKLVSTPVQMVIPELSIFLFSPHTSPKDYTKAFSGTFELINIKDSNHTFSNINNPQILFEKTLKWFNKWSN